ncbi:MAG: hypothetical protein Q8Q88_12325 [Phenylobacterium sp.]|uniref:hypothetical protein n=1 Tax=Phenylobacterium sp. TaxID=1871053 RepID=UPI00273247B6|nr:hypothetical protein [Phenylobacterium sp.]MDP3747822.1 hypothetical protein [Phenylobacterium sp.]
MTKLAARQPGSGPARDPRPSVSALLADPAVRTPLKAVLRSWVGRDPVDAAEDAGLLALALERIADEACGRIPWGPAPIRHGGRDDHEPS